MTLETVLNLRFEHGMSILNYAIDQESIEVVNALYMLTKARPQLVSQLLQHKYAAGMQAIHQVMSLGNLELIETVVVQMRADCSVLTNNCLSVMHCAAQTY
jgi:hypothetical protein